MNTECEPSAKQGPPSDVSQVNMCKRPGRYVLSSPISEVTDVSLIECGVRCLSMEGCKTYNYHRGDRVCDLLPICANPFLKLSIDAGFDFWGNGNC